MSTNKPQEKFSHFQVPQSVLEKAQKEAWERADNGLYPLTYYDFSGSGFQRMLGWMSPYGEVVLAENAGSDELTVMADMLLASQQQAATSEEAA